MKKFKDTNNQVHEIEDGFEHLLPIDAIEISDAEVIDLLAPSLEELEVIRIQDLKKIRDDALNALVYDFGDGRIIQTRPKDEPNIRMAIEAMKKYNIASRMWSMIDNKKYEINIVELETAYDTGVLAGIEIWDIYNP